MKSVVHFGTLRLIVITLAVGAQVYLFLRLRQAIKSWYGAAQLSSRLIALSGLGIGLLFIMNYYIMSRPILWVDPPAAAQDCLFYLPAAWSFGSIISAVLLLLMQIAGWSWALAVRLARSLGGAKPEMPVNPSRRRFLQAAVGGVASVPLLLSGYAAFEGSQAYEVRELALPFGLPLRVVQLSDIHAGIYMSRRQMGRLAEQVMALRPELLVLTGDFISNSLAFLPGCLAEMGRIQARYGTFAILGNHENWYGELSEIRRIFRQSRLPLLYNAHRVIHTDHGPCAVAGIDDLCSGYPDLRAALQGLPEAMPKLVLSHRPEIFPQAAAYGIALTLAGHYHGGQIKVLPGTDLSLANLLTPYPEGLFRLKGSRLYVNRGIGTTFTPVRLNVPPEITLLHLA